MSQNIIVIGLDEGDEGKARWADYLATEFKAKYVVRWQGGGNAGHTVYKEGVKYVFHQIPSAINSEADFIIGPGCVVNPDILVKDIQLLGDTKRKIFVDYRAPLALPLHIQKDIVQEKVLGSKAIGTTCQGIGPAYADFVARKTLRFVDLISKGSFVSKWREFYCGKYPYAEEQLTEFMLWREQHIDLFNEIAADTVPIVRNSPSEDFLFEGAQSIKLDLMSSQWPNVTSTSCHPASICTTFGISAFEVSNWVTYGVIKPYTTKVGGGYLLTEMDEENASQYRELGNEYGATTGRPRRCAWLDLVELGNSIKLSGTNRVVLSKYDIVFDQEGKVRSGLDFRVCTGYGLKQGKYFRDCRDKVDNFRKDKDIFPIYTGIKSFDQFRNVFSDIVLKNITMISKGVGLDSVEELG